MTWERVSSCSDGVVVRNIAVAFLLRLCNSEVRMVCVC
jgi:hypothetical protein